MFSMYLNILEFLIMLEYKPFSHFFIYFWEHIWTEWLILHVILTFILIKIWQENNLIKLIFLTIYFLIIISIYLGTAQLELFGCFLFVSEFIILLFFYCLIINLNLKLRFSNTKFNYIFSSLMYYFLFLSVLFLFFNQNYLLFTNFNELYINFYNLYKLYNNFLLNDLTFFFQNFFHYNLMLFLLVGIILLLVTFIILYFISLFHFFQIYKRSFYYSNESNNNEKGVFLSRPQKKIFGFIKNSSLKFFNKK